MRACCLTSLLSAFVCCGPTGCTAQAAPEEAAAIAAVERLGGKIKRDERRPGRPVIEVGLGGTRVTDDDLGHLAVFPELQTVALYDSAVGDAGLGRLHACTNLQTLYLGRTQVTDDGLAHLATLKQLRTLGLSETRISDAGLAHLSGLKKLKSVNVHGARTSAAGIGRLQQALPRLVVHR